MRIRVKAEAGRRAETPTAELPATGTSDNAVNGASALENGSDSGNDEDADTLHSRTATAASTATTAAAHTKAGSPPGSETKEEDKGENDKASNNLVGKVNNLVTSDLDNIINGRDFLFISESLSNIRLHYAQAIFSLVCPSTHHPWNGVPLHHSWMEVC